MNNPCVRSADVRCVAHDLCAGHLIGGETSLNRVRYVRLLEYGNFAKCLRELSVLMVHCAASDDKDKHIMCSSSMHSTHTHTVTLMKYLHFVNILKRTLIFSMRVLKSICTIVRLQ